MKGPSIDDYQRRLQQLPHISKQIQEQIKQYTSLVQDQQNDINAQNMKIKLYQTQMSKLDKVLQTRQNQIQQLTQTEEKSSMKQKKYFMQIQNYNKKIQALKGQLNKSQKSINLVKKEIKVLQTTVANVNNQKNKAQQLLTKGQLKLNSLTQTLNELKVRAMQQGGKGRQDQGEQSGKRQQRQLNELFAAIKKQMQLIDVLKKQKVHLVASTIFKYCQQDFTKLLEMNGNES